MTPGLMSPARMVPTKQQPDVAEFNMPVVMGKANGVPVLGVNVSIVFAPVAVVNAARFEKSVTAAKAGVAETVRIEAVTASAILFIFKPLSLTG